MNEPTDQETESNPVEQILTLARDLKKRTEVFSPIIVWQCLDETADAVIAGLQNLTDSITDDLNTAFQHLRKVAGPPDWFAVILDSYARDQEVGDDKPSAGELAAAFKEGDPKVVEQMVTIFMEPRSQELTMIRQVYRYLPSEGWEFDPPQWIDSPDDAVCTAVRTYS